MNDQTTQVGLLRQLAKSAKQRLKTGNYLGEDKSAYLHNNVTSIKLGTGRVQNSDIIIKLIDEGCQTAFCNKVREFLVSADSNMVINPMNRLIDHKYMDSLSPLAKQRYLFDISEKYNKIKQEYLNEQISVNA